MELDGDGTRPQEMLTTVSCIETQMATTAVELDRASTNRAALPCHYIQFPKNKRFVGRDKTLDTLERMFFTRVCQRVAVIGLGGVGKTQVALKFAY